MAAIKIILKKNKLNKEGKAPLVLRLTHDRKNSTISLKRYVDPKYWNDLRSRTRANYINSTKLNMYLDKVEASIRDLVNTKELNGDTYTVKSIINEYKGISDKMYSSNIVKFLESYIDKNPESLSYNTIGAYIKVKNCIKKYNENADFKDLNKNWLEAYAKYLKGNKLAVNTIYDRMKVLRKITKLALNEELIKQYPFANYKLKTEDSKREFLTIEELQILSYYVPISNEQYIVKQLFLFGCYTGIRFSDICNLKWDDVKLEAGVHRLTIRMQKTQQVLTMKLSNKALILLPKRGSNKDFVFSIFASNKLLDTEERLKKAIASKNAFYNRVLKDIMSNIGVNKSISFHCSRHTFATISLQLDIPITVVSKLLGHKNITETQIYAKIVDSQKDKAMANWDKF